MFYLYMQFVYCYYYSDICIIISSIVIFLILLIRTSFLELFYYTHFISLQMY